MTTDVVTTDAVMADALTTDAPTLALRILGDSAAAACEGDACLVPATVAS